MDRVTINIGSVRSDGSAIAEEYRRHVRDYVLRRFGRMYGGASAQDGVGSWVNSSGQLVVERNTFIWSYAQAVDDARLHRVARVVSVALDQDSVMVAVEDGSRVDFVGQDVQSAA